MIPVNWFRFLLLLSVCVVSVWEIAGEGDYLSDYIETPFDEFGLPITHDRLAEIAAMKATKLGYGLRGSHFDHFQTNLLGPHRHPNAGFTRAHKIFKRDAEFGDMPPFPSERFVKDPFSKNPFSRKFASVHTSFIRDPTTNAFQKSDVSFGSFDTNLQTKEIDCSDKPVTCDHMSKYRSHDGHCNNLNNPTWGATMQPVGRFLDPQYSDGNGLPRMYSRIRDPVTAHYPLLPTPRYVSRQMLLPDSDDQLLPDISNMFQQWGQFIDHDLTGTPVHKGPDGEDLKCCHGVFLSDENQHHPDVFDGKPCFPIYIPQGDRHFSRSCMSFARSQAEPKSLRCGNGHREQMNMITAFIDGSHIYGSSMKEMEDLRTYSYGTMKVTDDDLLPADRNATCVLEFSDDYCFKAGDMRVNENPGLMALHTAFHRYHNRIAIGLSHINPHWKDERLYQEARKIMGAMMQHITFNEWLPLVLGNDFMNRYDLHVTSSDQFTPYGKGNWYYDTGRNPRIMNSFAAAAFRFGHSLVPGKFSIGSRKVSLHTMFNRPNFILQNRGDGVNQMCTGLINDAVQFPDNFFTTSLTDRLFEDDDKKSLDLAALNIQRGRDHGLPPYNDYRKKCGLPPLETFDELVHHSPRRAQLLNGAYAHVDDIDLFPGAIAEVPVAGGVVGPTFGCIIAEQFKRIKFGDRFWYETSDRYAGFTYDQVREIKRITLARVLCSNTRVSTIQRQAFLQPSYSNQQVTCDHIDTIDFSRWASRS